MTIALDVNPLIYASNSASPLRTAAIEALADLHSRAEPVFLFWPVAVSYVRQITSGRIFPQPLSLQEALGNIHGLWQLPNVRIGVESSLFLQLLSEACTEVRATGNLVPDAHIVALMRQHGVSRILTHDRDFRKFDGIRVVDPFV